MVQLLKSTMVLGNVVEGHDALPRLIYFDQPADEDTFNHSSFFLPSDKWKEMGSPDKITVTIEPGDRLNP